MFRSRARLVLFIGLIGAIGAGAPACARMRASTTTLAPPLDMPAPPPRTTEATDPEPPPTLSLPEEPAHRPPPARRPAPTPSPKPDTNKPDLPKADAPPPVVEAPKPAEEVPKPPPPSLQTAPAGRDTEEEQRIRMQLAHATSDLNRIDYRALNADARTQYNTAKRFVTQAEEALRAKNLVLARSVADKAAAVAAQLAGK